MAKAKGTEMTRLINSGWAEEMKTGLRADKSSLRIISPFITARALNQLLAFKPREIQVITRFSLDDFSLNVSDTKALAALLDEGGQVRGVSGLHAKLYLFGNARAIVTSANLTLSGLTSNHEYGLVTEDKNLIATCQTHFADLWGRAGANLKRAKLNGWKKCIDSDRKAHGHPNKRKGLGDFGTVVDMPQSPPLNLPSPDRSPRGRTPPRTGTSAVMAPVEATDAPRSFVKFFGEADKRIKVSSEIFDQIQELGCHWCVSYRKDNRPRQVEDGSIVFIARLTDEPDDIRIFGRAIGMKHDETRDDVTLTELEDRPWRERWPHYIRVHDAEFIGGTLEEGISLTELMKELKEKSFATTQHHAKLGKGNTNPRAAYRQQPSVELSPDGFDWINERLEAAFEAHGRIVPKDTPDDFDWPDIKGVGKNVIR